MHIGMSLNDKITARSYGFQTVNLKCKLDKSVCLLVTTVEEKRGEVNGEMNRDKTQHAYSLTVIMHLL